MEEYSDLDFHLAPKFSQSLNSQRLHAPRSLTLEVLSPNIDPGYNITSNSGKVISTNYSHSNDLGESVIALMYSSLGNS